MEAPTGYITREYFDLIINSLQKQIGGSSLNVIVNQQDSVSSGTTTVTLNTGDYANVLSTDKVYAQVRSGGFSRSILQASASNGSVNLVFNDVPSGVGVNILVLR